MLVKRASASFLRNIGKAIDAGRMSLEEAAEAVARRLAVRPRRR